MTRPSSSQPGSTGCQPVFLTSQPPLPHPPDGDATRRPRPGWPCYCGKPVRILRRALPLLVRLALGLLLVWAGLAKLAAAREFYLDLLAYRLPLPDSLLRLTATIFPCLEFLVGGGLLFNRWPDVFRPLAAVITTLFVLVLGQALVRGLDINCGCFGQPLFAWASSPLFALARALLLLSASLFLLRSPVETYT